MVPNKVIPVAGPVLAEAGAAAFGAEDTAVAAGLGCTAAAVDPTLTCWGPAGVATVVVRGGSTTLMLGIAAG